VGLWGTLILLVEENEKSEIGHYGIITAVKKLLPVRQYS
jgi:hypothetical protein